MKYGLLLIAVVAALASCTINRNVMFKTDHDYVYDSPPTDSAEISEYKISPNDMLLVRLFANDGAKLLDITAGTGDAQQYANFLTTNFLVEVDGMVELPELGEIEVAGLTLNECEELLEQLYSDYYVEPFAFVQVLNNRVIVFPGTGSQAAVITLQNANTTVIEAIALAGGLAQRADARKVKLIRYFDDRREIYLMDLSTIEGVEFASMVVQANDVIYVEPVPEIASEVMSDLAPYVTLVSGIALIYAILQGAF
ncbi:MAG: polysaccharide biosynthesis/export family protein [Flavobacteriales bacterium]|nr:polysaccharide biosynthesis/export family protein [Flavobacteriales bacterium]